MHAEKRVIRKRKMQDGEIANVRDEGGIGTNIIHNTSTTTMGPTSEDLRNREAVEAVQDHKTKRLTKPQQMSTIHGQLPKGILKRSMKP